MKLLDVLRACLHLGFHSSELPPVEPPLPTTADQQETARRAKQEIEEAMAENERRIAALRSKVRVISRKPR